MRALKSVVGVIMALVPVVYCGGLIYYFLDVTGSVREADANGLGPTLVGLAVVGLLFSIPLIVKILRVLIGLLSPASGDRGRQDASAHDGAFDADATVARYMAQRSAEPAAGSSTAPLPSDSGGPASRRSFGRKVK